MGDFKLSDDFTDKLILKIEKKERQKEVLNIVLYSSSVFVAVVAAFVILAYFEILELGRLFRFVPDFIIRTFGFLGESISLIPLPTLGVNISLGSSVYFIIILNFFLLSTLQLFISRRRLQR